MPKSSEPAGLYVHVPFCRTKCPYCDFYSIEDFAAKPSYLRAVLAETARLGPEFQKFDSIYFGGGTPSVLDGEELAQLLKRLRDVLNFAPDTEITIEANPDDVSGALLDQWRAAGVNRLSIAAQSFHPPDLQWLGRRHTVGQTREAICLGRRAGFSNLGLDLMYGLRGQANDGWKRCLDAALESFPEHLSCYLLSIESHTPFGALHRAQKLAKLDEDSETELYTLTSDVLTQAGYWHYEISNFAKSPNLRSRHNSKYWNRTPYLGLGPSAHSFLGDRRWWNVRSVTAYCSGALERGEAIEGQERLTDEQVVLEQLALGLRCADGVGLDVIQGINDGLQRLNELVGEELVIVSNGRVIPTRKGYLVADALPLRLASR